MFQRQDDAYQTRVATAHDWLDSTVITNGGRRMMRDWIAHKVSEEFAMSPDWDNRWRTGGSVEELKREAHIDPASLLAGINKFAAARNLRLQRISWSA